MHSAWQLYDVDVPRRFNVPGTTSQHPEKDRSIWPRTFIPANGRWSGVARALPSPPPFGRPSCRRRVNGPLYLDHLEFEFNVRP